MLGCQDARRNVSTAKELDKDDQSVVSAASLDQQHTKSDGENDSVEPAFLVGQPTADQPVTAAMAFARVPGQDATSVDIWIKLLVTSGYYIYASNEGKTPFTSLQVDLRLPSGVEVDSELTLPNAQKLSGKFVYFNSVVMHRRIRIATEPNQSIEAIIHYQACNEDVCFPPAQIRIVESLTSPL